jgi:hypothetical protein
VNIKSDLLQATAANRATIAADHGTLTLTPSPSPSPSPALAAPKLDARLVDSVTHVLTPTTTNFHLVDRLRLGDWFKVVPTYDGPPILGSYQAARADQKFANLNIFDKLQFALLEARAGSQQERDYLRKALACGYSIADISTFADQIRGKSPQWLHENLRLTGDADGAAGLTQQWNDSCAPATAEVVRGEMDPIYSLAVHQNNTDIHSIDPRANASPWAKLIAKVLGQPLGDSSLADEEKKILEDNGGVAVERGQSGGAGMSLPPALNAFTQWTGHTYSYSVANTDTQRTSALSKLDDDLAQGIPGALRISDGPNTAGGHFVAVTGSIDGPPKEYVIHDPWDGKTVYVKASDLQAGNIIPSIAGWTKLTTVYT